ncbi:MAG: hypothetical protein ABIP51_12240, partial [Bacteroidia bacterium]
MALKGTVIDFKNQPEKTQEDVSSDGVNALQELQNSLQANTPVTKPAVEMIENESNPEALKHASTLPEGFAKPFEKKYKKITVQLPSKGLYYPKNSSCNELTEVVVRQLTAPDEDVLFSRKLILN